METHTIQIVAALLLCTASTSAMAGKYAGNQGAAASRYSGTGLSSSGSHYRSYSTRGFSSTRYRHRYGHPYGYGYHSSYRNKHNDYFRPRSHRYSRHGYRVHGSYGYYPGLVWGILSIPGRIIDGFFGYPYYYPHGRYPPQGADQSSDKRPAMGVASYGDVGPMGATGPGWVLLANGHYAQAGDIFSRDVRYRPSDGVARVGLSLSAAAGGDLERGVWAMRRAVQVDPEALVYVTLEASLQDRVDALVKRYQRQLERSPSDTDAAFMLASLSYLLGDDLTARRSIDEAVRYGDESQSTESLKRLIAGRQPLG